MNKEKIRTEKERKRINCTKQKLAPNGKRGNAEIGKNETDEER